jgi:2'-5' RNA ligase
MIFPSFENMQLIEDIRKKYDPLSEKVWPHITLVFPFESCIESIILKKHVEECIKGVKPFKLVLNKITPSTSVGNYLFLNVKQGKDDIINLHKSLYTGLLEQFYPDWLKGIEFIPHMTVGNLSDTAKFTEAIETMKDNKDIFETIVNKISVEIIDINDNSIIEMNIPL